MMNTLVKKSAILALALCAAPLLANAMPAIGDVVGTNAEAATAVLEKAGCTVTKFESEDGMIEAVCTDTATNTTAEIVIDPATGAITDIKQGD